MEETLGPLWSTMSERPRRPMATLVADDVPDLPGAYALFRGGNRVYVGKAGSLRERVWGNHSGRGAAMTGSALRRNVAAHLGIASAADIKARRYQPTAAEVEAVRDWLDGCEIAWWTCASDAEALALETDLKTEYQPLLTKR